MAKESSTFSESWHRVAAKVIYLRAGVQVRRQMQRGKRWIVIENPFSNQFFRLRPETYEFVSRLRSGRTVGEVWDECIERFPENAPGQEEVVRLLAQLYHANLLHYDSPGDAGQLFERYKKRRQKEVRSRLLNIMFLRIPLIDPDRFLVATLPAVGRLVSLPGVILWCVMVSMGIKVMIENWSALAADASSVLAPNNLLLLYIGMAIAKVFHEFGHAYVCRKFGGEVHTMGLMLLIFTPVPYMDATSSWKFREKWKRISVASAGMVVEIFVAAIAALVWANTGAGTVHTIAYNLLFVASVSTVLFNINPLLRFDGYYILSDLLEIANLHQQSAKQLKHVSKRYLFGYRKSESPTTSKAEKSWLVGFGILSQVYRIVVFAGIALFVADQYLLLGILMGLSCLIGWVIAPIGKFLRYLGSSAELERCRTRAVGVTAVLVGGVLAFLSLVPFPNHYRAPGVIQALTRGDVSTEVAGTIEEILAQPGSTVEAGQPLVRLSSQYLELRVEEAEARLAEVEVALRQAMEVDVAALEPLQKQRDTARAQLRQLLEDQQKLVLRARLAGRWVAPRIEEQVKQWLPQGRALGMVIDPHVFEFSANVLQRDARDLFVDQRRQAELRLYGDASALHQIADVMVIEVNQERLISAALGWRGGGDVPVAADDPEGMTAAEPFFLIRGVIDPAEGVSLAHGRSGIMRIERRPEPMLPRWIRKLRQLLQERYQF